MPRHSFYTESSFRVVVHWLNCNCEQKCVRERSRRAAYDRNTINVSISLLSKLKAYNKNTQIVISNLRILDAIVLRYVRCGDRFVGVWVFWIESLLFVKLKKAHCFCCCCCRCCCWSFIQILNTNGMRANERHFSVISHYLRLGSLFHTTFFRCVVDCESQNLGDRKTLTELWKITRTFHKSNLAMVDKDETAKFYIE